MEAITQNSGFFHGVAEAFPLLGCYAAEVDIWLPVFWKRLSVPSASVEQSKKIA
jgi:hypothetical protein